MRRLLFGRKIIASIVSGAMLLGLMCGQMPTGVTAEAASMISLTDSQVESLCSATKVSRQSVHDPSVIDATQDGKGSGYYVYGSHMGAAKTTDLQNWESVSIGSEDTGNAYYGTKNANGTVTNVSYNEAFKKNELTGTTTLYKEDGTSYTVDFGTYNINQWISSNSIQGNQWAPDIIYNKSMKKWCMYLSLNGNSWNSAVILLTADDIEGPYVYQAPIVFSGFYSSDKSYQNTDLELVMGTQSSLPSKYNKGTSWGTYWPHAIDPCVFYDKDGKLWMSYGSWSGGIYMLELDEKTGLRDYSVKYDSDYDSKGASVTTDEYFGKKIAGGCYVSGEGSYIQRIGDYYYLFMSYGFYSPTGGYNMRIFRSSSPDGPYRDVNNASAIYTSWVDNYRTTSRGVQLMGNYQWNTMDVAEVAQGHNSAMVDDKGNAYVIYHTKFGDDTAFHELRVHQLFTNENGWIVAAPYEYAGESVNDSTLGTTSQETADIVGDYDLLMHIYNNTNAADSGTIAANTKIATPVPISLNEDGTITGAYTGTWTEKSGTAYATIVIDGKTYKGVFVEQTLPNTTAKTMCFTAVCESSGESIWGTRDMADDVAVAWNAKHQMPSATRVSLALEKTGEQDVKVSWASSNPSVIATTGNVSRPETDTTVTLTRTLTKGQYSYSKEYQVSVYGRETGTESELCTYDSIQTGMKVPVVSDISEGTGVSLTFKVTGVESDWTPMFTTDTGEYVYLSVLNYGNENIFESSATLSAEAEAAGYTSASAWTIFTDKKEHEVTISYNVSGEVEFYRDGTLMLTYPAATAIGTGTAADLCKAMETAAINGQIHCKYNMTDVSIGYAKDYKEKQTVTGDAWWSAWTRGYCLTNGSMLKFDVTDMKGGTEIWNNLVAIVCSCYTDGIVAPANFAGYTEYAAVRADNYSWVDGAKVTYEGGITNDDAFINMMKDASGTITMSKQGNTILYYYEFTGKNGTTVKRTATITQTMPDDVYVFFVPDNSTFTLSKSAGHSVPDGYDDIADYKMKGGYPTKEGSVFAGWFTGEDCKTAISTEQTEGVAYAKFVDEKLLTTKYQITANTTLESQQSNLRLLLGVDNLDYQYVGFEVATDDKNYDLKTDTVCSKINVTYGDNTVTEEPSKYFPSAKYVLPYTILGINQANFSQTFTVTPYWVTLDGTTVKGTTARITKT
ncbi:MAG: glycoside hydrolase family 43 protein [Eubacterium sp.]|nr:glycoside hydrolase family 43 protein [Eubacterium sp.]